MYHLTVFLHVLSAFVFALMHGASTKVILKLRSEKNPERLAALLGLSSEYTNVLYISLLVMILAGVAGGFLGKWWGTGWIWLAIALLFGIFGAMYSLATAPLSILRKTLERSNPAGAEPSAADLSTRQSEIDSRIAAIKPGLIAAIGYGGLAIIIGLMAFKPF